MTKKNRFATPNPALAVGTAHAGFTVTRVEAVREISGTAYLMRHDATGARMLWLACADTNRSFSIAFKTPPVDDTGVFHILEHSVLCGSDRYPVKEPFVNLLKTSMQTFLNAMTFPDKTMYPVASTNVADLENLMGVYLDAVLHPAIYHRPRIFEQEGWHLEADESGALSYNGVVFNEMKGALSDPEDRLYQEVCRQLFPDTAYGHESGGNPRAIPSLTYEAFLDTHAHHYALANSYTILYGDLNIDRELALIDERFREATAHEAGAPNPLALQAPVRAPRVTIEMATAPSNSSIALSYVLGTAADRARVLAVDVLLDALCGSNEAPLKRAVLDAGIADDFSAMLVDGVLQPQALLMLRGLRPGAGEKFRSLVESTCAELAEGGIPRDKLEASLAQAEFNLREGDFGGYPDGIALSIAAMSSWLYDDERPLDYLRYEDALAELKRGLDDGLFERLLRELVCESAHSAEVELVPSETGDAAEEAAELERLRAGMSEKDVEAVRAEVAALRAEQEAPDSPEALAALPRLGIADVEPPAPEPEALEAEAPLPCTAHELDTHGIAYVYHYFDLRRLEFSDLPYVGLLSDLLGKLDTELHPASDLDTLVETNLGGLDFFTETYARDEDLAYAAPALVVGASALSEKVDALATLPAEVWGKTRFDDLARMRDILTQRRVALEQYFVSSGHTAAAARANAYFSSAAVASSAMAGLEYYLFLRDLLGNWEERSTELPARLSELAARVFTADDVLVSFTGSPDDRERFWAAGGTLALPVTGGAEHRLSVPTPSPRNEAFVIPSDVCYVVRASGRSGRDAGTIGCWQVATRPLSYDYLWNEVRVKGGAYGCGFRRTSERLSAFWSFRDPSIDATLARYDGAAAWLAAWDGTDEELEGYVVATVASHDAPVKPRQMARRQDVARFGGKEPGWRDVVRAEELAATADNVRALATVLADESVPRGICVFGGRDAIEASTVPFDAVVELVR
ncbi:insulinase family protein [Thermophilibacter provencensis]|uniref:Insulinase family protein n=1 Tax=Thermophilibacter provencensis TaxID=1852386 RepID=A0ABT7V3C2_9ACTN|nr:insulinase family protein [Thermophilibacter provencensis]MDM8271085.1 insulinase family protein [Thermophilibacter provencensis]